MPDTAEKLKRYKAILVNLKKSIKDVPGAKSLKILEEFYQKEIKRLEKTL